MKPTIWVRSAEVATGLDTNQKGAQTTQVHHPPKPSLDIPWFCFYLLQLSTTQITQPTSHWAWLFFKPSATWMHPSVPKSVNRTSCPAAFYDPNFVETFGACVRLMEPTTFAGSDPVQPGPNMPQPPNPPGVQELEHRMLPQDLCQGCGTSWKKVWKKWQKLGGSGFFLEGGQICQQKIHNFFKQLENLKNKLNTVHLKDCFFLEGGSKRCVNVKTNGEPKKTFYRPLGSITPSTCGSDGVQLHDQLCQRLVVLQAIEECDRTWSKKPRANAIRKVRVHHKTPNIQMPSTLYSHVVYWGYKLLKHLFFNRNTTLYNFDHESCICSIDLRCLLRACTVDTIVAQIQTLQGVIRANGFTKCLSTCQR